MVDIKDLRDRKKEVSGQVSAQTRTYALGLLAISWTLLTAHEDPLKRMAGRVDHDVIWCMTVIGFVILACDLFQYIASTSVVNDALHRAEASADKAAIANVSSFAYKAADLLYTAKIWLLSGGSCLLVWIFVDLAR